MSRFKKEKQEQFVEKQPLVIRYSSHARDTGYCRLSANGAQ